MPREFDRCVNQARHKKVKNPYAICRASMGTDAQIKARRKKTTQYKTELGKRPK